MKFEFSAIENTYGCPCLIFIVRIVFRLFNHVFLEKNAVAGCGQCIGCLDGSMKIVQFVRHFILGRFNTHPQGVLTAGVSAWAMLEYFITSFGTRLYLKS